MNKFFIVLVACFFSLTANATTSHKAAASDKEDTRDALISKLYGRWEGEIDYQYFENAIFNKKYKRPFAIEITPKNIEVYHKNDAGAWVKVGRSYINSFKFGINKNTISGYFLNSGTDEDGLWVESQTLYITLRDDHSVLVYSMRAVNNTAVKDAVPGTKWMEMGAGELQSQ